MRKNMIHTLLILFSLFLGPRVFAQNYITHLGFAATSAMVGTTAEGEIQKANCSELTYAKLHLIGNMTYSVRLKPTGLGGDIRFYGGSDLCNGPLDTCPPLSTKYDAKIAYDTPNGERQRTLYKGLEILTPAQEFSLVPGQVKFVSFTGIKSTAPSFFNPNDPEYPGIDLMALRDYLVGKGTFRILVEQENPSWTVYGGVNFEPLDFPWSQAFRFIYQCAL